MPETPQPEPANASAVVEPERATLQRSLEKALHQCGIGTTFVASSELHNVAAVLLQSEWMATHDTALRDESEELKLIRAERDQLLAEREDTASTLRERDAALAAAQHELDEADAYIVDNGFNRQEVHLDGFEEGYFAGLGLTAPPSAPLLGLTRSQRRARLRWRLRSIAGLFWLNAITRAEFDLLHDAAREEDDVSLAQTGFGDEDGDPVLLIAERCALRQPGATSNDLVRII